MRLIVLAFVLAFPAVAGAQAPERAAIEYRGEEGVWFRLDVAQRLLRDVATLPEAQLQVRLLESKLELRAAQVTDLRAAIELGDAGLETLDRLLMEQTVRAIQIEERMNAWYRHPVFLMGVGVLLSAAVGVAIVAI